MSEEQVEQVEQEEQVEQAPKKDEPKIMCFVSKQMVPMSETVEIEYMPHKKVHVLPRYVRYDESNA